MDCGGRVVIEFLSGHSDHHMPKKVNSLFSELTFALPVKKDLTPSPFRSALRHQQHQERTDSVGRVLGIALGVSWGLCWRRLRDSIGVVLGIASASALG